MTAEPTWIEIRDTRLRNDHRRMLDLTSGNDLIAIEEVQGDPAETYVIRFNCRGVSAMEASGPVFSDIHRVWISLPVEYPTRPPQMRFLTPVFHPNINEEGTYVCVDTWYPSKFLDDLCIMLGRMIQYKNYNPSSPLRLDAAQWAVEHPELLPVDRRPLHPATPETADTPESEIDIRIV
jgi:ubiquitin-protein ligase